MVNSLIFKHGSSALNLQGFLESPWPSYFTLLFVPICSFSVSVFLFCLLSSHNLMSIVFLSGARSTCGSFQFLIFIFTDAICKGGCEKGDACKMLSVIIVSRHED